MHQNSLQLTTLLSPRIDQLRILDDPTRFKSVLCGRRWGKTYLDVFQLVKWFTAPRGSGEYWWVCPTYDLTMRGVKAMREVLPKEIYEYKETKKLFKIAGRTEIVMKSADNPDDSLLGSGLKGLIGDEFAMIKDGIWTTNLRPTLTDYRAPALFTTTPRNTWFKEFYLDSKSGKKGAAYAAYCAPSWDNYILYPDGANDQEIMDLRHDTPEAVFNQEYGAEFMAETDAVFRNVDKCFEPVPACDQCSTGRPIMGLDLAKHVDYTVIVLVCPKCGQVIHIDRFHRIDWEMAEARVVEQYKYFNCAGVVPDSTGVGDPFCERLRKHGLVVEGPKVEHPEQGYVLTNRSKAQLIQGLMVAFERMETSVKEGIQNREILRTELTLYQFSYTASGVLTYNAPNGKHDDCVIAYALAWWGYKSRSNQAAFWAY